MRSFRCVLVLAGLALTTACSSSSSDDAETGDDANLTQIAVTDVKVESAPIAAGASRKYAVTPKDKARIHAVPFAGNAGDAIEAQSHAAWSGTLYVLKKVGAGYAVVSSSKADAKKTGTLDVTLRTGGSFFVGFEAKAPASAKKTASSTVTLSLAGTSPPADSSFVGKLKSAYGDGNAEEDFVSINEGDLPAGAKKDWNALNKTWAPDYPPTASKWKFQGKTVYVVENDNDGGMSIDFFDENGKALASGSASESGDFIWGN